MNCIFTMNFLYILSYTIFLCSVSVQIEGSRSWTCVNNKCVKNEFPNEEKVLSLGECKATCLKFGGLWPRPTGTVRLANSTSYVDLSAIKFVKNEYPKHIDDLIAEAQETFIRQVKHDHEIVNYLMFDSIHGVDVKLEIYDPSIKYFETGVDESYQLSVTTLNSPSGKIEVVIKAQTFFGFRHGLVTLGQLIFYDDVQEVHKIIKEAFIEDKPVFTHRGILLDTSRSYIPVDTILKLLDVMGMNKLNTFHWHITDTHSFPYVSVAYPELSQHGAYSKTEVYTQDDIKFIVSYAQSRGIRIIPECNGPSHVGEGWVALKEDMVTCFKWMPWRKYCVEPPCGQLDPTNAKVYEVLGTLYKEYVDLFHSDMFHMAGDEVNFDCWNATKRIVDWMKKNNYTLTKDGFHKLWGEYQNRALKKLKATKSDPHPQAIIWTSTLTEPRYLTKYLNPLDYVIQVWTLKEDPTIKNLINNKFRIILSNYDELYFDCGNPTWVGEPGENWCSPYIGWQIVYDHSPYKIIENQGFNMTEEIKLLVLGSEAAVWTEQIDKYTVETRFWPRAAALGERLWSNPKEDWTDAQFRMNHHRERIAKVTPAELLQPKWCYQNDGYCD